MVEALDTFLDYDKDQVFLIEPKPNEPVDSAIIPTIGHAIALAHLTKDPARVCCLIESAHSLLAGLDPSDDMGFAIAHGKLRSVHLNDQGGLKFDQDKSFGAANLRMAYNQVRVLELADYAATGRFVGLDVKAMRTQQGECVTDHLANSRKIFLHLVDKVRSFDKNLEKKLIESRDYEALEMAVLAHIMGV